MPFFIRECPISDAKIELDKIEADITSGLTSGKFFRGEVKDVIFVNGKAIILAFHDNKMPARLMFAASSQIETFDK